MKLDCRQSELLVPFKDISLLLSFWAFYFFLILIEGLLVYFHKEELVRNIELSHPWASLVAQSVKNAPAMQENRLQFLGQRRSSGEGNGNALQYSCLENSMDREPGGLQYMGCNESDTTEQRTLTLKSEKHRC